MSLKQEIQARAAELGFDLCRVTTAASPASAAHFQRWIEQGHHGLMAYLERNADKRVDPQRVLPGAVSCIVLAASYFKTSSPRADGAVSIGEAGPITPAPTGVVARYARFKDYHDVMGEKLAALSQWLDAESGVSSRSLWYVDTGPILERDFAQRAGIGFVGKHTNVISRRLGNWFLLGEILTQVSLEPDLAEVNRCGHCTRCLSACPTQAITAPFQLDARRCISYLTIELKGPIPLEFREAIGDRIFGCDDCLAVCPWNRFAQQGRLMRDQGSASSGEEDLLELLGLDEPAFRRRFHGTPILRSKRRGLLRNVCVALGNTGGREALPALERASLDLEPLIAEHARWAIARIEARKPQQ